MDVRAHVSMVFHLDKCIGCHTCSVACKNVWTDRPGAEYMWWNNVETKPGTGYPTRWEDQEEYTGGWETTGKELKLKSQTKANALLKLFYNPNQPGLDDYYEPFTYRYQDLFDAEAGDDQPTAVPISQITGEIIDIESGPNWDDDLSGSPIYAENDKNLDALTPAERAMMFQVEGIAMMYLPRICNHCVNPACVASCPSGAMYKRGEDGIVLINQEACRGWRACVTACPYKKTYYNWKTGKSEKCILCFPRLETGQAPACFHSCVGRIRYLGVLLYDASRLEETASTPSESLVEAQRQILLDPNDPEVIAGAKANGITPEMIESAQQSPVYKWVVEWELALPLHPEFRTIPMLYYVPPLLPVTGRAGPHVYGHSPEGLFGAVDQARLPIKFLAEMFSAGNAKVVEAVMRKLVTVRLYHRAKTVGDVSDEAVKKALRQSGLTPAMAEAIYELTALASVDERYVMAPLQREEAIEPLGDVKDTKGLAGLGSTRSPRRGS